MTNPQEEQRQREQQRREAEQKQGNPGQKQGKQAPTYSDNPVQDPTPEQQEAQRKAQEEQSDS